MVTSESDSPKPPAAVKTSAPATTPAPAVPCLTVPEALAAATIVNQGLPGDATVRPGSLHCDATWAWASLTSQTYGSVRAIYHFTGGRWTALALGSGDLCASALTAAPQDVREAAGC